jgi:predicted ATPase
MITKIVINKPKLAGNKKFSFFCQSPLFKDKTFCPDGENLQIDFTKGVNILVGDNGSGKSTILKMIGEFTASYDGGVSTYTGSWHRSVDSNKSLEGIEIHHCGKPFYYSDGCHTVGLISGHFDDDFFSEGFAATQRRGSSGEVELSKMTNAITLMAGKIEPNSQYVDKISFLKSVLKNDKDKLIAAKLNANIIDAPETTIIFDEPELHVSLMVQNLFWNLISKRIESPGNSQIIIASHSPFPCSPKFSKATIIELSELYVFQYQYLMKSIFTINGDSK